MNGLIALISIICGLLLGLIYFGGLWFTVQRFVHHRWPPWAMVVSFIVRMGLVLVVFYGLLMQHWTYVVTALIAFVVTRQILINRLGKPDKALYG